MSAGALGSGGTSTGVDDLASAAVGPAAGPSGGEAIAAPVAGESHGDAGAGLNGAAPTTSASEGVGGAAAIANADGGALEAGENAGPVAGVAPAGDGAGTSPSATSDRAGAENTRAKLARGKLSVVSTLKGQTYWSSVSIDGVKRGTTPLTVQLSPGKHRVRLERSGFRATERTVTVTSGKTSVLRLELQR